MAETAKAKGGTGGAQIPDVTKAKDAKIVRQGHDESGKRYGQDPHRKVK